MKHLVIMIVCLSSLFFGCKKENEMKISQTGPVSGSNDVAARTSTSGTQTIYEVDPVILGNFKHYCQKYAGPVSLPYYPSSLATGNLTSTQAGSACGPTSYMMAAYCIAKWADPNTAYTCDGVKLASIYPIVKNYVNQGAITLPSLKSYADNYDNSFIITSSKYGTNRSTINQFIKDELTANRFVITGVNAYTYDYNAVNNSNLYGTSNNSDLNASGNTTTGTNKNYISVNDESTTVGGHIILLLRLATNPDGTGIVEYIDPLAQTKPTGVSNKKYVSFSRLLTSIQMNGNNTYYDAISIGKK